jgi:outer membrane protein assembly factor BamA
MARCGVFIPLMALAFFPAVCGTPATGAAAGPDGAGGDGAEGAFAVSGNAEVGEDEILAALRRARCARPDSTCLKAVCDSVAYLYWTLGYIDVKVTCTEGGPGEPARVEIAEGAVSPVEAVDIAGASDDGRLLVEPVFEAEVGKPFSPARFERAIALALRAYDDAGFPVARITPDVVAAAGSGLRVVLVVEEGPRATIGSIVFDGVVNTKHSLLQRETGLVPGEIYDGSRVEEARQNLMALGVFESVSEPRLSMNRADSSLTIAFEAVEARTSFVEGAFAYGATPTGNEVYGQMEMDLRNIGGTLRRAGVYWMKRGDARTAWAVHYGEPRLFTLPVGLSASLDSDIDEAAYERRRFSLRLVQRTGRRFEVSAGWFLAKTREGPLLDESGPDVRESYTENGLDIGLVYDGTDRIINPTRGLRGNLTLEFSSFVCDDCDVPDRTIWSGLLGGSYIFPISGNTVGFVGASYAGVGTQGGTVPPSRRIRVGGVNSLRGYPEEWFVTDGALIGTAEMRYIAGPHSRLFAFLDAGLLEGIRHEVDGVDMPLLGYGFGLTTGSRIGIFRIEVASARGEALGDAKLHLRLTQRF